MEEFVGIEMPKPCHIRGFVSIKSVDQLAMLVAAGPRLAHMIAPIGIVADRDLSLRHAVQQLFQIRLRRIEIDMDT